MPEPAREEIILAIIARLQAMTGVRPGFGATYPNELRVMRDYQGEAPPNHRPTLAVIEGPGSTVEIDVTAGVPVHLKHLFTVLIIGWVAGDATVTAATWKQRLWDDMNTQLMALTGDLAVKITRIQWLGLDPDDGDLDPQGEWVQPLVIEFHEEKSVV